MDKSVAYFSGYLFKNPQLFLEIGKYFCRKTLLFKFLVRIFHYDIIIRHLRM